MANYPIGFVDPDKHQRQLDNLILHRVEPGRFQVNDAYASAFWHRSVWRH